MNLHGNDAAGRARRDGLIKAAVQVSEIAGRDFPAVFAATCSEGGMFGLYHVEIPQTKKGPLRIVASQAAVPDKNILSHLQELGKGAWPRLSPKFGDDNFCPTFLHFAGTEERDPYWLLVDPEKRASIQIRGEEVRVPYQLPKE